MCRLLSYYYRTLYTISRLFSSDRNASLKIADQGIEFVPMFLIFTFCRTKTFFCRIELRVEKNVE